jgi:6-phosphogluconate dehydrogenase
LKKEPLRNLGNEDLNKLVKNIIKNFNSRLDQVEERISELEDRFFLKTQTETKIYNEHSIWDFWDTIKRSNVCLISIPEGEEIKT